LEHVDVQENVGGKSVDRGRRPAEELANQAARNSSDGNAGDRGCDARNRDARNCDARNRRAGVGFGA
jgi:hypothetical protein